MAARVPTLAGGLLERDAEVERLERVIAAAVVGKGSTIALEGEAGVGKTSLLDHARGCAGAAEMEVLSARGGEIEREFAYGVVRQLFESPLAAAARADRARWLTGAAALAAPVLSAAAPTPGTGADPGSVMHGLYWMSANLAAEQPLLIAVDDAHWADDASISFLSYLARRIDELAIVIVYAARRGEGASNRLPAVADPELARIVLRPSALSQAATTQLIENVLAGSPSERFARACHVATNGNPFLLSELLRVLEAEAVVPESDSAARVERIAPEAIARATLTRLRRLGEPANELAFAVSVLGARAELRHAAALARLELDVAAQAADVLAAAAILRDGRPLEFIHPIVRTTIYKEIAAGKRAADHKRAARLLAQDGTDAAKLAPHLLAAEPVGDRWVVEQLRTAAHDVVARGAPDAACTYLERALREPTPQSDRGAVLLALGAAEVVVARPTALEHLRAALQAAEDAQTRLAATYEITWALAIDDRFEEAFDLAVDVLADDVASEGEERRLQFEGWLAAFAQFAPSRARAALERIASYEGRLRGETAGERLILACLAHRAAHHGASAAVAAQHAELAIAEGRLLGDVRLGAANYYLAVSVLLYADRFDDAERYLDLAVCEARERGLSVAFDIASACRCQVLIRQGRLVQAEAEAVTVLSASRPHAVARPMLLACLMHTMVERTDPTTWQPFLVEHAIDADLWGRALAGMLLFRRGHMWLAAGNPRAALDDFEQMRRRDELSGQDTPSTPVRASQALAHMQLGDRDAAQSLAAEQLERAQRWGTPSARSVALRTAGVVHGGADGIEMLRKSAKAVEHSAAAYERAQSLTELGAALRRAGHRRDALEPLRDALDLADRCGALRLAARAREELVVLGARPRRAARRGCDALTPSELRVAQLAADGRSNREIAQALFVTVRTVEGHLTQTYMKLDISSREQLAKELSTHRP